MYIVISLCVSLIVSYALETFYDFYILMIISFFTCLFLSCFFDTVFSKNNIVFNAGCVVFKNTAKIWFLWLIEALPLALFLIVSIGGGIITAPILYFTNKAIIRKKKGSILISNIITLCLLYGCEAIIFINPLFVFQYLHYGFVIGLIVIILLDLIITQCIFKSKKLIGKSIFSLVFICTLGVIPVLVLGFQSSRNYTYHIYNNQQMNAFGNAPTNYNTVFILENDLDFTGEEVNWFGGQKKFQGVFDGQGYTLSNITINTKCRAMFDFYTSKNNPQGLGFVRENDGIIKNVNFSNCTFTIRAKSSSISNFSMYFGIVAACNVNGAINDCNIINCKAKYVLPSKDVYANMFLIVGTNINSGKSDNQSSGLQNINVLNDDVDESFYEDDIVKWIKINK